MAEPLRHRQTKGAETDMPSLPPPRHIPTLPIADQASADLSSIHPCERWPRLKNEGEFETINRRRLLGDRERVRREASRSAAR
jgi:hypothetical protein